MNALFTTRQAGGADVSDMFRIYNGNLDEFFQAETLEYFMLQWPKGQLVATAFDGTIAGALSSFITADGYASIALLAVDSGFRGRGAGSALLSAFFRECFMSGIKRIQLEVRVENEVAQRLYASRGFVVEGRIPNLYSNGGDGLRMVKILSAF